MLRQAAVDDTINVAPPREISTISALRMEIAGEAGAEPRRSGPGRLTLNCSQRGLVDRGFHPSQGVWREASTSRVSPLNQGYPGPLQLEPHTNALRNCQTRKYNFSDAAFSARSRPSELCLLHAPNADWIAKAPRLSRNVIELFTGPHVCLIVGDVRRSRS